MNRSLENFDICAETDRMPLALLKVHFSLKRNPTNPFRFSFFDIKLTLFKYIYLRKLKSERKKWKKWRKLSRET